MTLQSLVCEESVLTFLAIQWRSIVNHLGMNLTRNRISFVPQDISQYYRLPSLYVSIACGFEVDPSL